jgi:hypothetical protein
MPETPPSEHSLTEVGVNELPEFRYGIWLLKVCDSHKGRHLPPYKKREKTNRTLIPRIELRSGDGIAEFLYCQPQVLPGTKSACLYGKKDPRRQAKPVVVW